MKALCGISTLPYLCGLRLALLLLFQKLFLARHIAATTFGCPVLSAICRVPVTSLSCVFTPARVSEPETK